LCIVDRAAMTWYRAAMTRCEAAVRRRATAFFVSLAWTAMACVAYAQSTSRSALDQLVQQAVQQVQDHYTRPMGRVAERQRERIFVLLRQIPPAPGTVLEVVRPGPGGQGERVIGRVEVLSSEAGLTECREQERVGRVHAEAGDVVRRPIGTTRLLLAPCIPLLEVAPEIPEVIGERLRAALANGNFVRLTDNPDAERRAEAAYLGSMQGDFVAHQTAVDEVLYPVLMQTPGKLVLNLEYYTVQRGRATDIDVASAALDDLMRAWLRAGRARQGAPPGFRRLPPQTHPWHVVALGEGPGGDLLAVDSDSVHVLALQFPGLRLVYGVPLGGRARHRRDPWCTVVNTRDLQTTGTAPEIGTGVVILSDERRATSLLWASGAGPEALPQVRAAGPEMEPVLDRLWSALRAPTRRPESHWWPAPGQLATAIAPSFADLDADGRVDAVWSSADGSLSVKLAAQRVVRTFAGFGDIKAAQPARAGAASRAMLWLTDPVWHGEADRLHAAQLGADDLQVIWSSEPFEGTLVALISLDLNGDGSADLVAAEALEDGTRLHPFLALAPRPPVVGAPGTGGGR
jgi:hypothetical protein